MYFGIDQLTALYPRCFLRPNHLRRPLKSDIRYDLIARHPKIPPVRIASTVSRYTGCVAYWLQLRTGLPRIDLDGNVAGVVTAKDERYAQRMIAGLATRAAAKAR